MRINTNKLIICEISLISLLWLVSVLISQPLFNRPLDTHHEWLTAHTLVSMRAFEEWGFWRLLGVSCLIPKSYELLNVDIRNSIYPSIYLSYPSLWLVLPYLMFKFLNLLHLNIDLNIAYLQTYHLILNRLILGIIIYYLAVEFIKIIGCNTLTIYQMRLVAFLYLVSWMFTPPVMYWTQNVYFSDQAVLLPIYTLFLISLKCQFQFKQLSKFNKGLLLAASFIACSIDWYAWVVVALILMIVFVDQYTINKNSGYQLNFVQEYWKSSKFVVGGIFISGVIFGIQLIYYKNGINSLLGTFLNRSVSMVNAQGISITLQDIFKRIINHWIAYFPRIAQIGLSNDKLFFLMVVFLLVCLYYIYRQNDNKKAIIYMYILIFLAPLVQITFLKQHSFIHDFSAFKMAMPIAFSLIILPIFILIKISENNFFNRVLTYNSLTSSFAAICFVAVLSLFIISSSRSEFITFGRTGRSLYQELGFIVSRNIGYKDLLITDSESDLVVKSFPPQPLWYTNKYIYSPKQLQDLHLQLPTQNLQQMQPVFLTYKDLSSTTTVNSICQGQWLELPEKLATREFVICKASQLRHLLE